MKGSCILASYDWLDRYTNDICDWKLCVLRQALSTAAKCVSSELAIEQAPVVQYLSRECFLSEGDGKRQPSGAVDCAVERPLGRAQIC